MIPANNNNKNYNDTLSTIVVTFSVSNSYKMLQLLWDSCNIIISCE